MNPFEMVVLIVAIVMIAGVLKTRGAGRRERGDPREELENRRLREEVKELKERLHVLERIATDRENSLAREIDELRDR
ncbi:MAG: hypothetical protein M3428_01535 [Pseudomonadota bacterium]|jgi:hypothetical protein|nr:hypothetical protein [Sphingomonas sp.]MDQ3471059.1 hypothetical protein [Pseudomonadota bacterium]